MKFPLINKYSHEIETITEFKSLFAEYSDIDQIQRPDQKIVDKAISLREELNILNGEVANYVRKAKVPSSIFYSPPPAVGGMTFDLDFFANLFNLRRYSVSPQTVIDVLDRSIGNYQYFQREFNKKLLNPIYWVGEIIRVPFHLLNFAGFNSSKVELSWVGKIYKFIVALLVLIATILAILDYIGVDTKIFTSKSSSNGDTPLKQENPTISGAALAPQQPPLPKKEPRKETQK